jgi:hypothetical protein
MSPVSKRCPRSSTCFVCAASHLVTRCSLPSSRVLHTPQLPVSICTFVLVKQVNWVPVPLTLLAHFLGVRDICQYLYFSTSRPSKLRTWIYAKFGASLPLHVMMALWSAGGSCVACSWSGEVASLLSSGRTRFKRRSPKCVSICTFVPVKHAN